MLDFLQYDFMQRAMLAGLIIATCAPVLGMFLTVRRQSLIADTLAHVSLAGVTIGFLLGWNPLLTAGVVAIIVAIFMERIRALGWFANDALLALILSGSLSFAVVGMSAAGKFNAGVLQYLFGGITTVSPADLWLIAATGGLVLLFTILFFKEFFLVAFDESIAEAQGLRVRRYNMLMALMTAATVVAGMRVVGVLLMGALMIIPVLSATRLRLSFQATTDIAVAFALLSVILGLTFSYTFDLAAGGAIVLVAIALFVLANLSQRSS